MRDDRALELIVVDLIALPSVHVAKHGARVDQSKRVRVADQAREGAAMSFGRVAGLPAC